ncbi:MAG: glycoside hydrolase family 13 protein [Arachnia propionica]|nr:glycoside hydrolase family 13 protein [Arachnia propionica]
MSPTWWRDAVVYQIYPRSFADGNADGIGDLAGILAHVDHLVWLGVDAVWLSPFYASELADGGYDVIDHRAIDPRIGTLEEFDALVAALGAHEIKVIIDIVPNHSSDLHPWFQEALASGRGSQARGRYHFRDGTGERGELPPSDWESLFGGPAWTRVDDGQWYLHTFAKEQPDLNWDHPEVRRHFLDVLEFWADRGVAGFRIDAAHMLIKHLPEALPSQAELNSWSGVGDHPVLDRDELRELYRTWREVFNRYDPPRTAVAEAAVPAERVPMYASPETLGQSFFFDLLLGDYDARDFHGTIDRCLATAAATGSSVTWVLNNHDTVRSASRYGTRFAGMGPNGFPLVKHGMDWLLAHGDPVLCDAARGLRRARAAALVMLALPGSAYLYQGEELGLPEVAEIPDDRRADPAFFRNPGVDMGRDGCRVPLPWTRTGASFGFGDGGSHLPQPAWFGRYSVEAEREDPDSTLHMYREALRLRRELGGIDELEWLPTDSDEVLHFRRGPWHVVANFGTTPAPLPDGRLLLSSGELGEDLPGETTAWLVEPVSHSTHSSS